MMLGLVEKASRLRKKNAMLKEDINRLAAEAKDVLELIIEISELKTTAGSSEGSLQEIKDCVVQTKKYQKNVEDTTAVADSHQQTLAYNISYLMEELSYLLVKRTKIRVDLDAVTALKQPMKGDVQKSLQ